MLNKFQGYDVMIEVYESSTVVSVFKVSTGRIQDGFKNIVTHKEDGNYHGDIIAAIRELNKQLRIIQ